MGRQAPLAEKVKWDIDVVPPSRTEYPGITGSKIALTFFRFAKSRPRTFLDSYGLKGGVVIEFRFAEGARATKDIDIGVPVERTKPLRAFQDAVALGFDDFTFLLKGKPLNMDKMDAVRLELAIRYLTRAL